MSGGTPWLNAVFTGTDWAPRPVPNAILTSAYKTGGVWNASHYSNKALDKLIDQFTSTPDIGTQRSLAAKIDKHPARRHAGDPAVLLQLPRSRQEEHQGLRRPTRSA